MTFPESGWIKYIDTLSAINKTAAQKFVAYLNAHDVSTAAGKKAAIDYAYALSTRYGEMAAAASCEMYDAVAEASGVILPAAEPAATATYGEVARMYNGMKKQNMGNEAMGNGVGRLVKRAGADTVLQNAKRDGAEFAWVPHGDTCSFCLMLASNGWRKASKKTIKGDHAEHIHANCDCTFAIRFDGKSKVEGFDPDKYREMYDNAEGDTWQEKLNSMRRDEYAANADKIRAQKREAYDRRTTSERGLVGESGRLARSAKKEKERDSILDVLSHSVTVGKPYVDPQEIVSEAFNNKFSGVTDNSAINNRLRRLARAAITHNNGTYTETVTVIDAITGKKIIQKTGEKNGFGVTLDKSELAKVFDHVGGKIGIHNHPTNILPTGSDFVAAASRGYQFGIVVTHDLKVYKYTGPTKYVTQQAIDLIIDKNTRFAYTDKEKINGFWNAMDELERRFGITCIEL